MTRSLYASLLALTLLAAPSTAEAQLHQGDIIIGLVDDQIATGVPGDFEPIFGERVFATEFTVFLPNWTDMPGFDSLPGAFPPNTQLGFDIQAALRVWDEIEEHFHTIPVEGMRINKGAAFVITPIVDQIEPGYVFGAANSSGKFHEHVGYELLAPSSDGIYLLELTLWSTNPAIEDSLSFWILFNKNRDQQMVEEAAQWVRDNLIDAGIPGDINGDGCVDHSDLAALLSAWGTVPGDPNWNPDADLTGDGTVAHADLALLLANWGEGC